MRFSLTFLRRTNGFTLVEIAVVLVVAGLFIAGGLYLYKVVQDQRKYLLTEQRMDVVMRALAEYVNVAGRLPCPADPAVNDNLFGWEWGVNAAGIAAGRPIPDSDPLDPLANDTCLDWSAPPDSGATAPRNVGIVPFLSIGLPDAVVRDAWGRYFTYAVSPVFAQNNDDTNVNADPQSQGQGEDRGNVHIRCLDSGWVTNKDTPPFIDQTSGPKAKFCCAKNGNAAPYKPDTDIAIRFAPDGGDIWPNDGDAELYNDTRSIENYFQVDPAFDNPHPDQTDFKNDAPYVTLAVVDDPAKRRQSVPVAAVPGNYNIAAPALVLISHGRNGSGAFLADGTRGRYLEGAPGNAEIENGAGDAAVAQAWDRVFFIGPLNDGGGNAHFDDIVLWRTQDGIMAETGTSSCVYP